LGDTPKPPDRRLTPPVNPCFGWGGMAEGRGGFL
jgi:hypothetical protein